METRTTRRVIERSSPPDYNGHYDTIYRTDLEDLWEAGYEVIDSCRRLLSDIIIGVGEVITPSSYYSRHTERESTVSSEEEGSTSGSRGRSRSTTRRTTTTEG
jgi:hypothetical protein